MTTVTFLGTGPGDVDADRFNSSILIQSENCRLLLDAGEPCAQRLKNLGFALPDLDAVLLTHGHADHIGGLPLLLQASWLAGRESQLTLVFPEHLVAPFQAWLRAIMLPPEVLKFPLEWKTWTESVPLSLSGRLSFPAPQPISTPFARASVILLWPPILSNSTCPASASFTRAISGPPMISFRPCSTRSTC